MRTVGPTTVRGITWEPTVDEYTLQDGTVCEDVVWQAVGVDYDGGSFYIFDYDTELMLMAIGGHGPNVWDVEFGKFETFLGAARKASRVYRRYLAEIDRMEREYGMKES